MNQNQPKDEEDRRDCTNGGEGSGQHLAGRREAFLAGTVLGGLILTGQGPHGQVLDILPVRRVGRRGPLPHGP